MQELYEGVRVRVLYQRDYLHLLVKYGLEPPSQLSEAMGEGAPLRLGPDVRPLDRAARGRERLSAPDVRRT